MQFRAAAPDCSRLAVNLRTERLEKVTKHRGVFTASQPFHWGASCSFADMVLDFREKMSVLPR